MEKSLNFQVLCKYLLTYVFLYWNNGIKINVWAMFFSVMKGEKDTLGTCRYWVSTNRISIKMLKAF